MAIENFLYISTDEDAEKAIVGALLNGEISWAELGTLEPQDFYFGLNRWIVERFAQVRGRWEVTLERLEARARAEGVQWTGRLIEEYGWLRQQPFCTPAAAREYAKMVREMALRRRFYESVSTVIHKMRAGGCTHLEAIEELRVLVGGTVE